MRLPHLPGQLDQLRDHLGGLDRAVLVSLIAFSSISVKDRASTTFLRERRLDLVVQQLAQQLQGQVLVRQAATSARNSSERIEISGFFSPAAAKMSITRSDEMALDTSWRIAWSRSSADLAPSAHLGQPGPHGLEEPDLVADRQGLVVRAPPGRTPWRARATAG